ncbi:hypothetical protein tinsulaeT_16130 [Thalassotalea insulae]|uniref:Dehydrogenase n=1 Tax=Thalassotalea insulae TaxID=2056778 RepID=A0ABQ6GQM6_9GAMM|nr:class I SAM-dependent methyltransferase [Thalassotalea insulae]GLX78273.1 hypothetical protein tinsulaeT_16130 [Thalassotalea insulae]
MIQSRRKLLKAIVSISALMPTLKAISMSSSLHLASESNSNFKFIYGNSAYKDNFYQFLVNVFHLYPELEFHQLIDAITKRASSDQQIYIEVQNKLNEISSFIAPLTYSMPALSKQKQIIADQTQQLLHDKNQFSGYLEIGSTGRYLDALEERFTIENDRYFVTDKAATYSPIDMIDRGQIIKAGSDILFNNYQPALHSIPRNSLDLVTVYIGFHHCPVALREEFITNIRDTMSTGGYLVVRDHDVNNKKMHHIVALAHDVFNLGTMESWQYNNAELRNFYALAELDVLLNKLGFKSDGKKLFQQGDPTLNALMVYQKV